MVRDGGIFEHDGHAFRVEIEPDYDAGAPWEREDGHGDVTKWTARGKQPGEMILATDGQYRRYYDFAGAVRIAKRDGWDAEPFGQGTRGQRAARAAMADYECLRRWCTDQWQYVGVTLHLLDDDGDDMGESESLWGIESDASDYLDEVTRELASDIIARVAKTLAA